jgi:hypothetical protein
MIAARNKEKTPMAPAMPTRIIGGIDSANLVTRLAMPDRRLRYRLLVRARQRSWGWISRTSRRLRNRHRSVDQGQQRYRRDQLSHDGSPEFGHPLFTINGSGETRPQGAQTSRFRSDVPSALARLEGWASSGRGAVRARTAGRPVHAGGGFIRRAIQTTKSPSEE